MVGRKQHVIKMAHKLFIEKGYRSTSIQDILDFSGISKGTFYNYFSSKSELFKELLVSLYQDVVRLRNEQLIGKDESDLEGFIDQLEKQLKENRKNRLQLLIDEVMFSEDPELKQYINLGQAQFLQWTYHRFLQIFGEERKEYLLDCAIMFKGMLQQNYIYHSLANEPETAIPRVVRYTVERIVHVVEEVSKSGTQLTSPSLLDRWRPERRDNRQQIREQLTAWLAHLRKQIDRDSEASDMLDFIEEELTSGSKPRTFLLDSVLLNLKTGRKTFKSDELQKLEQLVDELVDLL